MSTTPVRIEIGATLAAGFKTVVGSAQKQMDSLGTTLSGLGKRRVSIDQFQKLRTDADHLGRAFATAKRHSDELRAAYTALGPPTSAQSREMNRAEQATNKARTALERHRKSLASLREEMSAQGLNPRGTSASLAAEQTRIGSQMEKLRSRQGALVRANEAQQRNRERGQQAAVGAMGMVAVGAVLAQPLMEFANFEAQMSRVAAVGKSTKEGQQKLTNEALHLGETTKFTAVEVGQGMEYLSLAGFNTQKTLDSISGVLSVAAAAGSELETSANIVSNALSSMGMSAKEAARVGDVLTMTFTSSNTTLESLGETLQYCAPVAAAVGMEFELLSTAAGLLGNAGIQGSSAGTALRKMMLSLVSPSKNARTQMTKLGASAAEIEDIMGDKNIAQRQAIAKLGIEIANPDGSIRDWEEIMRELSMKMGNLTQKERASVSDALVGKTGISGFLAFMGAMNKDQSFVEDAVVALRDQLVEQGLSEFEIAKEIEKFRENTKSSFDDLLAKNRAAKGTADLVAARQLDNVKGDWTILGSAVSGFSIKLGGTLAGATRRGTQSLTAFFGTLTGLIERFPMLTKTITLGTASALLLGIAFKVLTFAGSVMASPFLRANTALARLTAGMAENAVAAGMQSAALAPGKFGAVGNAIRTLIPSIWGMNGALAACPIILIGAAIVTVAVLAYKYWDRLSAFLGGVWAGMKAGFAPVLEAFAPLEPLFSAIGSALSGLCSWFSELMTPVQSSTETLNAWASAGEMVGQVLATAFNIVLMPVMGVVKAIGLVIEGINWLWENGSKIGDMFGGWGDSNTNFGNNMLPLSRGNPSVMSLSQPGDTLRQAENETTARFTAPASRSAMPGPLLRQAETMPAPSFLTPRPVPPNRNLTNNTTFNSPITINVPPGMDARGVAEMVKTEIRSLKMDFSFSDTSGMLYD